MVPGCDLHPDLGGARRGRGRVRRRICRVRPRPGRARPAGRRHRGPPEEPAPQGTRLAPPRSARPDLETAVPDRRGQRADRGRAGAAGQPGAATVRGDQARQGRLRPGRRELFGRVRGGRCRKRAAGAAGRPQLVDRAGRADRPGRGERDRQDHATAVAGGVGVAGCRPGQAWTYASDRAPQPEHRRAGRLAAGAGRGRGAAPGDPAGRRRRGRARALCWRTSASRPAS